MADFFKSAFGMLGQSGANGSSAAGVSSNSANNSSSSGMMSQQHSGNEFVGQSIQIGNMRLRVSRVLAEGGYAIVYVAQDVSTGVDYALKRIFAADEASNKAIKEEISYLKKLGNHPNIIGFISAACEENERSRSKEYLILTELCKDPLIEHLRAALNISKGATPVFNFDQVLAIFFQMCQAVQYMHVQEPPIIHRDLKLENFLVSTNNEIKLCDFGSATVIVYAPDNSWSANKRSLIEDEIAKQTTPMYRAPEMLDLYSNQPIDVRADIWALGCVLYLLCFNRHPFEDGAKLRIINGKFVIPQNDTEFKEFHDLIRCMLNTEANKRPEINEVIFHLENIAQTRGFQLANGPLKFLKNTESLLHSPPSFSQQAPVTSQSNQQQAAQQQQQQQQNNAGGNNWVFGNAAASLFKGIKTIKDASTKVMDSVQQSINRTEADLSYITSRLVEGIESAAFGNNIDTLKDAIELKHGRAYRIYNLSSKPFRKEKFSQHVIDLGGQMPRQIAGGGANVGQQPPSVSLLLKMCAHVCKYLSESASNVVFICCNDGRAVSCVAVCAILLYTRAATSLDSALSAFACKRGQIDLSRALLRYLRYTARLLALARSPDPQAALARFNPNECILTSITLIGVPLFNRLSVIDRTFMNPNERSQAFRNGCTPYVEIYNKEKRIYTNLQDYDHLKKYTSKDGQIVIPINCHKFYGDILIVIYHAKSLLGTEKITSTRICQFQFHTAFLAAELAPNGQYRLTKNELDGLDTADKYPDPFQIVLNIDYKSNESPQAAEETWYNQAELCNSLSRTGKNLLFQSQDEMSQFVSVFGETTGSNESMTTEQPPKQQSTPSINVSNQVSSDNEDRMREKLSNVSLSSGGDGGGGYSPVLGTSPQSKRGGGANLLNLDGGGTTSGSENEDHQQPTTATIKSQSSYSNTNHNNNNNRSSDIGILLDFGDVSASHTQQTTTTTATTPTVQNTTTNNSTKSELENLLGDISGGVSNTSTASSTANNSSSSANLMFDPFGAFDVPTAKQAPTGPTPPIIQPTSSTASMRSSGVPPLRTQNLQPGLGSYSKSNTNIKETPSSASLDPFADLAAFTLGGGTNGSGSSSQSNLQNVNSAGIRPNASAPRLGAQQPQSQQQQQQQQQSAPSTSPQLHRPNYSSTLFNTATRPTSNPSPAPSTRGAMFDDLLSGTSFPKMTSDQKANQTLKDIKREQSAANGNGEIDPDRAKVLEWTDGKKANIRALLCSMDKVLWDGENRWEKIGMHQLVTADQVKKVYRKAVLAVHPDKLTDDPNINLARMIFVELNDAWAQFQSEGQKNLF